MSEYEKKEVSKLREAFNELITSVDAREMSWNNERSLRNRVVECCEDSLNELYKFDRAELDNVKQAYELLGIAKGIEIALSIAGINTESIGEEITHVKRGHNKRVEQLKDEHKEMRKMSDDIMTDLRKRKTCEFSCCVETEVLEEAE